MQATASKTQGQELTDTLRRYLRINSRTRRYRKGANLHRYMIEALQNATVYPGYFTGDTNRAFQGAWAIYCAYSKHVGGHRIDPMLHRRITEMSPWEFAALLGQMVDAGVTNTGEGERFFAAMARER